MIHMMISREPSSFRDPSGYIFYHDGMAYRAIMPCYQTIFQQFLSSGLYQKLLELGLILPFENVAKDFFSIQAENVIQPQYIEWISYPYEWSYSQLQDAALLTLRIQKIAIRYGMNLKDASAYNIQLVHGKPVLIDHLSFEPYDESKPWIAYGQFCRHFLNPLIISKYTPNNAAILLKEYIDGISSPWTSSILPAQSWLSPLVWAHIHLHARAVANYKDAEKNVLSSHFGIQKMQAILTQLHDGIQTLKPKNRNSIWNQYYELHAYEDAHKKIEFVEKKLALLSPKIVIDMGANTGKYALIAEKYAAHVIAMDSDESSIDHLYHEVKNKSIAKISPIVADIVHPSPAIGWNLKERKSLLERLPKNSTVLALAITHHLFITSDIRWEMMVRFFSDYAAHLLVEFISPEDIQCQTLMKNKMKSFEDYTEQNFIAEFEKKYVIQDTSRLSDDKRVLYYMIRK